MGLHEDETWLDLVRTGHPPGEFGHREHLLLAWLVLEVSTDVATAQDEVSRIIQRIARAQGVPQRYNRTVTDAWVQIVAHCRAAVGEGGFEEMLHHHGWLMNKRALLSHYSSRLLASPQARQSWVEPDLLPIPA
jgi:hypothetical protein